VAWHAYLVRLPGPENTPFPGKETFVKVVVIGAGIGGLTTAAVLARAGMDVTLLEAHVYPGGCAGTFYHQGFRFEAGATLAAGFYPGGPMDVVAEQAGIPCWPVHAVDTVMTTHLPGGEQITRWSDERTRTDNRQVFGSQVDAFWDWQESTANLMWDFAMRLPDWPPRHPSEWSALLQKTTHWLAGARSGSSGTGNHKIPLSELTIDAFRPLSARLKSLPDNFRLFIDGQLLISAQTTSRLANALYAASALDLPRRGVVSVAGGIGNIAQTLAQAFRSHGGKLLYRQKVDHVRMLGNKPFSVFTREAEFKADLVVANLTPWDIARITGVNYLSKLHLPAQPNPSTGWGAFTVYLGVNERAIPADIALHQQVISDEPLGEGNSIFISISPATDLQRAPGGQRALTISTHTDLALWRNLAESNPAEYRQKENDYLERILSASEKVLPGLRANLSLVMPGTPLTFQRFVHRADGWVGGFPQTSLFKAHSPRLDQGLWLVGDSIFPGQSIAAVALGGLRVANAILRDRN
jgi:C-3',4' desaturase CrtD